MTKMMRRLRSDQVVYGRDFNRWADTFLGNTEGRISLLDDDGEELDLITGLSVSSNNYAQMIRSAAGRHGLFQHSNATTNVLDIQDAGVTVIGTFGLTGNATLTGNLAVSGTLGAGATTLASLAVTGNATVGGTLGVTGLATFGGGVTLSTGVLTLPAGTAGTPPLQVGDAGGLFRVSAGVLGISSAGVERARVLPTSLQMAAGVHVTLANNTAIRVTEAAGAIRNAVTMSASDITTFGNTGNAGTVVTGAYVRIQSFTGATKVEVNNDGVAFNGATPAAPPALPADATDLPTAQTLANAVKDLLIDVGLAT